MELLFISCIIYTFRVLSCLANMKSYKNQCTLIKTIGVGVPPLSLCFLLSSLSLSLCVCVCFACVISFRQIDQERSKCACIYAVTEYKYNCTLTLSCTHSEVFFFHIFFFSISFNITKCPRQHIFICYFISLYGYKNKSRPQANEEIVRLISKMLTK